MTVSVVMPVRDGERYLAEALDSVLAQTHTPLEVLVVDDGSRDRSVAIAAAFGDPVRVLRQPRAGVVATVNAGQAEARGEFVAFLDCDDLWVREKLELQLRALSDRPELDAVFGCVVQFVSPELPPEVSERFVWRRDPCPFRGRGTMLIRRRSLERFGLHDPSFQVAEFVDWHARAIEAGMLAETLDEVVLRRRLHDRNMGRETSRQIEYVRVARAALERRRAGTR